MVRKAKGNTERKKWFEKYKPWAIFLFTFLLYANTIPNQYNLDDELVTTTNQEHPHRLTSKGVLAIADIFSEPYYKDGNGYAYDYRPVVLASFAIEYSLFGANAHVSHFINAMLYAFLCMILFNLLCEIFKEYNPLLPLISALVFAAHPIHTEVVASIKNRDEILALLFVLLSLEFVLKCKNVRSLYNLFIAVFMYFLALLSKQTIVTAVLIIPFICVLFSEIRLIYLFLFVSTGLLITIPVSFYYSYVDVLLVFYICNLFIALVYLIKNIWSLNCLKPISVFFKKTQPEQYISNTISLELVVVSVGVILAASFFMCLIVSEKFLAPLSLLFLVMVFSEIKAIKFLAIPLALLAAAIVHFTGNLYGLSYFFLLFFTYLTFARSAKWFDYALLTYCLSLPFMPKGSIFVVLLFFVVCIYLVRYTQHKFLLKILPLTVLLISLGIKLIDGSILDIAISKHVVFIVVFLWLVYEKTQRYLWLLIFGCISLILITYNTSDNHRTFVNSINHSVNTIPTKVVPVSIVDRPVDYIESVTDYQSPYEYKLGTTAQVFRKYLQLLVIPFPQSFYYGYKIIDRESVFTWINLLTLIVYCCMFLGAFLCIRKNKIISVFLAIFTLSISVYSGLFVPVPGMMADRFLFVPSLGFAIGLAYLLLRVFSVSIVDNRSFLRFNQIDSRVRYLLILILVVYSGLTYVRNLQWKNHLTLFAADIDHLQKSAQANNLYALQLMKSSIKEPDTRLQQEMHEKAEQYFKRALDVYPEFSNAQYDLARTQAVLGKQADAEHSFYKAAKLNPLYSNTWLKAADIAMGQQRLGSARSYLSEGMSFNSAIPDFYIKLSLVYYLERKYDSANLVNKQAMVLFPNNPDFPTNIGRTFYTLNKRDSALFYFEKSLSLAPDDDYVSGMVEILGKR